jgi:hypothetical protein
MGFLDYLRLFLVCIEKQKNAPMINIERPICFIVLTQIQVKQFAILPGVLA